MKKKKPSSFSGILAFLILFALVAALLNYLAPIIPFLIVVVIIVVGVYLFLKLRKPPEKTSTYNTGNPPAANSSKLQNDSIKRQLEILTESTELVNNSNNLDTVLRRYSMVCNTLEKLSTYTDYEFRSAGYSLKEPLSNTLSFMQDNKILLFNQAISRNLEHDINSVSKNETKVKKIIQFRDKYENNPLLPPENKLYLNEQCNANILMHAPQNYTQINSIEHTVSSITQSVNGTFTYSVQPDNFIKEFYELSSLIESSKDIYEKIKACEKSYPLLKEYCRFCIENDNGELPPFINCRDMGPELYMRLGRWSDAERVIQICADANAYYPNNDNEIWTYYSDYKRIANLAVLYIQNNPGCMQNKIYNALNVADDDREHLKHFLRCSKQIRKEKYGKTNRLYCV